VNDFVAEITMTGANGAVFVLYQNRLARLLKKYGRFASRGTSPKPADSCEARQPHSH